MTTYIVYVCTCHRKSKSGRFTGLGFMCPIGGSKVPVTAVSEN